MYYTFHCVFASFFFLCVYVLSFMCMNVNVFVCHSRLQARLHLAAIKLHASLYAPPFVYCRVWFQGQPALDKLRTLNGLVAGTRWENTKTTCCTHQLIT